jgi:hypothetical protein
MIKRKYLLQPVEARLFQLYLTVFLNELTWSAAPTYKDVFACIAADPIAPAHIRAGYGLRENPYLRSVIPGDENDERTCSPHPALRQH